MGQVQVKYFGIFLFNEYLNVLYIFLNLLFISKE